MVVESRITKILGLAEEIEPTPEETPFLLALLAQATGLSMAAVRERLKKAWKLG